MKPSPAPETPLRVLYVGRLSPEKGVDILLRAWALLQSPPQEKGVALLPCALCIEHCALTIIGDGPERPALESLAATLGIADRVEFTGALSRASARAALASASLLVLPSICYETFGLVILDAASLGVPSIVTSIGGQASLVQDGITGRHVPPDDPAALAAALRELLADPSLLRRMGDAARAAFVASDCVPVRNLARLEQVYASCATPR